MLDRDNNLLSDIAENQLLLVATERLLRLPGVEGLARHRSIRLRVPLADEHRAGDLTVTGYTFNLWKMYEDFVTAALTSALTRYGGAVAAQAAGPSTAPRP